MALGSTVFVVQIELSDVDRGVYESLTLRPARHPSESMPYLVARLLAHALEHGPDLAFSRGLAASDEPALWAHDATGQLTSWVEIGTPTPERLHKARKAAEDVAVYCHKDFETWAAGLAGQKVHRAETVRLYALDRELVQQLADRLERRTTWSVTRSDGVLYVEAGDLVLSAPVPRVPWP